MNKVGFWWTCSDAKICIGENGNFSVNARPKWDFCFGDPELFNKALVANQASFTKNFSRQRNGC